MNIGVEDNYSSAIRLYVSKSVYNEAFQEGKTIETRVAGTYLTLFPSNLPTS